MYLLMAGAIPPTDPGPGMFPATAAAWAAAAAWAVAACCCIWRWHWRKSNTLKKKKVSNHVDLAKSVKGRIPQLPPPITWTSLLSQSNFYSLPIHLGKSKPSLTSLISNRNNPLKLILIDSSHMTLPPLAIPELGWAEQAKVVVPCVKATAGSKSEWCYRLMKYWLFS